MEAAFFDLDKTVISRSSVFALAPSFYREGLLSRRTMLGAIYRQLLYSMFGADEKTMERARAGMLAITRGWEQHRIRAIIEETVESSITPIVFEEALDLIAAHRRAGRKVFIVSSSPEEIVLPLAHFFGVEDVVATLTKIVDGRYTGDLAFYAYGPYKADRIRELALLHDIDLKRSYAYSDSITDLPMLEVVGNPVAVNADRALRRVARDRGWGIVDFHHQVLLRQRLPTVPRNIAIAALAVGGATLGYAVWFRRRHGELPGLEQALVRLGLIRARPAAGHVPHVTRIAATSPNSAADSLGTTVERARAAGAALRSSGTAALSAVSALSRARGGTAAG